LSPCFLEAGHFVFNKVLSLQDKKLFSSPLCSDALQSESSEISPRCILSLFSAHVEARASVTHLPEPERNATFQTAKYIVIGLLLWSGACHFEYNFWTLHWPRTALNDLSSALKCTQVVHSNLQVALKLASRKYSIT